MEVTLRTLIVLIAAVSAVLLCSIAQVPHRHLVDDHSSHEFIPGRRYLNGAEDDEEENIAESEVEILAALTEKLTTPRELAMESNDPNKLVMHQFLHLHHMKTGGTSMDRYLECARQRLKTDKGYTIPYSNIHECSRDYYARCKSGQDSRCQTYVAEASMLSYCAPLKDLPSFQWGALENGVNVTIPPSHGAITVLRHPVDRVWSMFRFKTKDCFKCMPLTDIYTMMDSGDMGGMEPTCYQQLQNHQVANLLSTEWLQDSGSGRDPVEVDEDGMLAEAIKNMKSFFTVIGLTEHLDTTIDIAGQVFPWMKPKVEWSTKECSIAHANSSPQNNRCGPDNSHWTLPDQPDDETRAAIEAHNQLDLKLYAAAVQHFELQKRAVNFDEEQV